jgi:polysaccharide biosynthesis/export protein
MVRSVRVLLIRGVMAAAVAMMAMPVHADDAMQPALVSQLDPGYRLGAEDVLLVSVWKDEQLTREVVVRPDGMFSFPLVGDIQAEERTVEDIRGDLVKRLTKYIPNPNVSIAVTKVNKPGEYVVGHYTDVLQALSLAGGLTPFAAENEIKVMRRVRGEQYAIPFRYGDVRKGRDLEQNIILHRGDVVMVP